MKKVKEIYFLSSEERANEYSSGIKFIFEDGSTLEKAAVDYIADAVTPSPTPEKIEEPGLKNSSIGFNHSEENKNKSCRVCGCTHDQACPGGCHWVEEDLCSSCFSNLPWEERPIAIVINNNQKGWENIVETQPFITLNVGEKLYSENQVREELKRGKADERLRVIDQLFIRKDGYFCLFKEIFLTSIEIKEIIKSLEKNDNPDSSTN